MKEFDYTHTYEKFSKTRTHFRLVIYHICMVFGGREVKIKI